MILKRLNETIEKKFGEWLKNPKKPEEPKTKYQYTFQGSIKTEVTLCDNGDFTNEELFDFIQQYHHENMWETISRHSGVDKYKLKRDDDLLDDCFAKWGKDTYGNNYWGSFLKEYFTLSDELPELNYRNYDNLVDDITIPDYEIEDYDSWVRVHSSEILDWSETHDTDNFYVKIICSHKANNKEDIDDLLSYAKDCLDVNLYLYNGNLAHNSTNLHFDFEISVDPSTIKLYNEGVIN